MLLTKLFFLGVRQLSKPVAARAKHLAQNSEAFRGVVVGLGRTLHRMTIQVTRQSEGKDALGHITPLNEIAATERGADFFSELLIYSIAGSTVLYEFNVQQKDKERKAEAERAAEMQRIVESRTNEERQWDEFRALNQRITLLQEELWSLRQREERRADDEAEQRRWRRRRGWWGRLAGGPD